MNENVWTVGVTKIATVAPVEGEERAERGSGVIECDDVYILPVRVMSYGGKPATINVLS